MPGGFLLGSDLFAKIRAGQLWLPPDHWRNRLYLLPLQREALAASDSTVLLEAPVIEVEGTPAAIAILMARFSQDVATCPADRLFGLLDRATRERPQTIAARNEDLIVGQLAVRNSLCLLTNDLSFARAVRQCGGTTMSSAEFLLQL